MEPLTEEQKRQQQGAVQPTIGNTAGTPAPTTGVSATPVQSTPVNNTISSIQKGNARTYLRRGSRGDDVKKVQRILGTDATGKTLVEDGIYGSKTRGAVKAFQRQHKIKDDGVVGPDTVARLNAVNDLRNFKPQMDGILPNKEEQPQAGIVEQPVEQQPAQEAKPIDQKSPTDGLDSILSLYTSPEQEEKYRKASMTRQRINAVADALKHIGNIYHVSRGATPQEFIDTSEAERQRYMRDKALRDKNNEKFISYQQARDALEAKKKQLAFENGLKLAEQDRKNRDTDADIRYKGLLGNEAQARAYKTGKEAMWVDPLNRDKLANSAVKRDVDQQNAQSQRMSARAAQTNAGANWVRAKETVRRNKYLEDKDVRQYATPFGNISSHKPLDSKQLAQLHDYGKQHGYFKDDAASDNEIRNFLQRNGKSSTKEDIKEYRVMSALRQHQDMGDFATGKLGWEFSLDDQSMQQAWQEPQTQQTSSSWGAPWMNNGGGRTNIPGFGGFSGGGSSQQSSQKKSISGFGGR